MIERFPFIEKFPNFLLYPSLLYGTRKILKFGWKGTQEGYFISVGWKDTGRFGGAV
jgi:hypothetical protein